MDAEGCEGVGPYCGTARVGLVGGEGEFGAAGAGEGEDCGVVAGVEEAVVVAHGEEKGFVVGGMVGMVGCEDGWVEIGMRQC